MFKNMWEYFDGIEKLIIFFALLFVFGAGYAIFADAEQWSDFAAKHDCKVISHIKGNVIPTFSMDGKILLTSTPSKTGYLCNDGVTYYR